MNEYSERRQNTELWEKRLVQLNAADARADTYDKDRQVARDSQN